MKRVCLLFLVLCGLLAAGAVIRQHDTASGGAPEAAALCVRDGQWPENEFTAAVPRPGAGRVDSAWLAEGAYCGLSLSGVDDGAFADYLEKLADDGFSSVEASSEQLESGVSVGTLWENGTASVSLSHQAETLVLYISLQPV